MAFPTHLSSWSAWLTSLFLKEPVFVDEKSCFPNFRTCFHSNRWSFPSLFFGRCTNPVGKTCHTCRTSVSWRRRVRQSVEKYAWLCWPFRLPTGTNEVRGSAFHFINEYKSPLKHGLDRRLMWSCFLRLTCCVVPISCISSKMPSLFQCPCYSL